MVNEQKFNGDQEQWLWENRERVRGGETEREAQRDSYREWDEKSKRTREGENETGRQPKGRQTRDRAVYYCLILLVL